MAHSLDMVREKTVNTTHEGVALEARIKVIVGSGDLNDTRGTGAGAAGALDHHLGLLGRGERVRGQLHIVLDAAALVLLNRHLVGFDIRGF